MCSYNRVNGVYTSEDPWLLTGVLRDEWGFDGLVVSDWGAVDDPVAAVAAGLDLEMPSSRGAGPRAVLAVRARALDESVLDQAVGRLLSLLDRALPAIGSAEAFDADAHHDLARRAAAECVVLLTNEDSLLPLGDDLGRVAIIGEFARSPRFQGAGSSKVNPTRVDDALGALRAQLGPSATVDFAPGFGVDDPAADLDALAVEAMEVASGADVAVLFLGLPPSFESEGFDRTHIDLPAEQVRLLEAVAAVNDRIVVVLANGGVVSTAPWQHHAGAIVEGWLGGQAGVPRSPTCWSGTSTRRDAWRRRCRTGWRTLRRSPTSRARTAKSSTASGSSSATGTTTWSARGRLSVRARSVVHDVRVFGPRRGRRRSGGERGRIGGRIGGPDIGLARPRAPPGHRRVTNTGEREGKEVVTALRVRARRTSPRPVGCCRGSTRCSGPRWVGDRHVRTAERDLSRWSVGPTDGCSTPGASRSPSGPCPVTSGRTDGGGGGGPPAPPLDRSSIMAEWLSHPVGHDLLVEGLRTAPGGDLSLLLADEDTVMMLGSFPLNRLATMMGGAWVTDSWRGS